MKNKSWVIKITQVNHQLYNGDRNKGKESLVINFWNPLCINFDVFGVFVTPLFWSSWGVSWNFVDSYVIDTPKIIFWVRNCILCFVALYNFIGFAKIFWVNLCDEICTSKDCEKYVIVLNCASLRLLVMCIELWKFCL